METKGDKRNMNKLSDVEKTGLATALITEIVWTNIRKKDRIWLSPEELTVEHIGIKKIIKIVEMYDQRSFMQKVFKPRSSQTLIPEINTVLSKIRSLEPSLPTLPKLRALEGIKVFDLHFGADHAEMLLYESVEEAIFEDLAESRWFASPSEVHEQNLEKSTRKN